jgi:hypothetical protein
LHAHKLRLVAKQSLHFRLHAFQLLQNIGDWPALEQCYQTLMGFSLQKSNIKPHTIQK